MGRLSGPRREAAAERWSPRLPRHWQGHRERRTERITYLWITYLWIASRMSRAWLQPQARTQHRRRSRMTPAISAKSRPSRRRDPFARPLDPLSGPDRRAIFHGLRPSLQVAVMRDLRRQVEGREHPTRALVVA